MSTIVIILAVMLACLITAGCFFWYAMRYRPPLAKPLPFVSPPHRKLSAEERSAVEQYVKQQAIHSHAMPLSGASRAPAPLIPIAQSQHVYPVTRAITRYGLSTDEPHKWRYYLDTVEVHLPPLWEQHIAEENHVELIKTQTIPLVISLNGHSLTQYPLESPTMPSRVPAPGQNASIRKEEGENVEPISVRKESVEEYTLSRPDGTRPALVIAVGLLVLFISLIAPLVMMPWLMLAAIAIIAVGSGLLYRRPTEKNLREIHCLRGAPKRWGLFGESNQGQASNISLGAIDLNYPSHWQNYIARDLGKTTEIDIYLNHQVVRQGRFLSLHDEARHFPIQRWRKNVVLAAASLLVLVLLITLVPLCMPLKLSMAWIKGADSLEVTQVSKLANTALHVGDRLTVHGTGMCSIPSNYQGNRSYAFMPFDCSAMYWNEAEPLPLPQSDVIDKASALLDTTRLQLHPQTSTDPKLNPHLATAIQKSGMILLDDFSDIVLKTQQLCSQEQDCMRLKNALVNLSNAKDWQTLVRSANSGELNGMNVLLRPVSSEALENLVNTATSSFFYRETRRAAEALNSPPPGGFLIINDEGQQLVNYSPPPSPLFDLNAPQQWPELQRLADMLLQTPFNASGIITSISTDANGTRHIALHGVPDEMTLWRYLGSSLLLLALCLSLAINSGLALHRIHRNRLRLMEIHQYYEKCFNHTLGDIKPVRPRF
ncbi:intracellular growth attenuator family protein [Erwinia pyrifoliae]|uniref:intracellular growth attenuator family protein n=1 Tax=Erwinia pyrifoliae TaxID=79967 RepID=UPI00223B5BF6|nr:intracellular growth attenuator family protein [Erwinia pyrifoliae]MCT2385659.1 intracellular growth attenuator family protein [Erwinia pyrifoliae]MCU8588765.1 intracellular growth attenuator family protein [Erwinia pyrifoliae]